MDSIFKIITSEQWQEAQITGLIPRCAVDDEANCILVNQFRDLEIVCSAYFTRSQFPVALEFSPDSYAGQLDWNEPTEVKHWREGMLQIEHLLADLVLNIYNFEPLEATEGRQFRLLGEE